MKAVPAFAVVFAVLLLTIPEALAGFRLAPGVFEAAELDEALERARRDGKPLAFFQSDVATKCGLCVNASQEMMRNLRSRTIMVYFESWNDIPPVVRELARAADLGKYIPRVVMTDPGLQTLVGVVTYESVKNDSQRAFREARRAISEYQREESS